ncbi:cilia- and flagella-associated protein 65-like [Anneissia japonica]|uniref:cilia- and flagella-associated protein 65-like n=1 Tax=Anneissia japonica TaxID=1529436 RepID=UPI001425B174|nr:cilia- and flagella-associated protein 65-like [Anneissia japonica]
MPSLALSIAKKNQQNKKTSKYGIEVVSNLAWKGWEPGGEYTKRIVLKNVLVKTQKIKYSIPNSRFFTTLYPETIVLSAGTSFSLPVTFRPLDKIPYDDKIEFKTSEGIFEVPLSAVLPKHDLSLPQELNFGMCAAADSVQLTFEVFNKSELPTKFVWAVSEPFVIQPPEGSLQPKSKCQLVATFKPTSAYVHETVAELHYGSELQCCKQLKLEGIGKYPHLLVCSAGEKPNAINNPGMENIVDFGDVAIGKTREKMIELHNLSPVKAPFTVSHPTAGSRMDTVFMCKETHGVVPAMGITKIPISYLPHSVSSQCVDYVHVQAIGNVTKTVVKLIGKCKGPEVSLNTNIVNFSRVDAGTVSTRTLDIVNTSDVPTAFQFMIDGEESVFKFSVECGTMDANTTTTVVVQFAPLHPINYYRRVACIVQNQNPLFVDLIGTCHTELGKPSVLEPKHLDHYRVHQTRGFSMFPPEHLNELLKDGKLKLDDDGYLMMPQAESIESYLKPHPLQSPMAEFINDGYCIQNKVSPLHVSMDTNQVDFGCCTDLTHIGFKTLNVTNNTKGKVTVVWMGSPDNNFSVSPITCDIPPLKMTSFRVTFKPNAPNQFFGAELEGYAFYKSMRDYRLVQDETFCPPWCLTVNAVGQTFQQGQQTFLPRLTFDKKELVFPAVDINDCVYKTVLMTNTGTTPIRYKFDSDPSGSFLVKPCNGLLRGKHQLFVFQMNPKQANVLKHGFNCYINDDPKYTKQLLACGSSETPEILLENKGTLFFKPTCIGTSSTRVYRVKNTSRVPLQFEWIIPSSDKKYLSVQPTKGVIMPNETQTQEWKFTPKENNRHVLKPYMYVTDTRHIGDLKKRKKFSLRVIGEGSVGEIKAGKEHIDLSDVVVGTAVTTDMTLVNMSDCSLHYKLTVEQCLDGPNCNDTMLNDQPAVELSISKDILPARSERKIFVTVRPVRRVNYTFRVNYQILMPERIENAIPIEPEKQLCELTTTGVYPSLAVTDARCYGSACGVSKARLWSLLSLDNLNVCLDSDPSAEELMYSRITRHSTRRKIPVQTRSILDFNFGAAPLGAEPCLIHLMIENTGTVPTDWALLFPSDLQLELEYWAETGEFDADELHEMRIMDNKLFDIQPRKGHLDPGQSDTITLTYNHDFAGTDRLPVLFKVMRGREILLNFIGVTVDHDKNYVHFPSSKHMFSPVPVGGVNNPTQVYELYNGGAVEVTYQLDLTALEYVKEENYNHKIFECLNPSGVIQAGQTANVQWVFSPLESKTYMVDVPIHIIGGDTALITFTGVGYDKRIMGDTMCFTDQTQLSGVPAVQGVPIPRQLLYLSEERISLGNLALFSQSRKPVYLTNRSQDHTVAFEWYVTSDADSQVIDIQPVSGTLSPGQSIVCKVNFVASGDPSFYDLDMVCEVTDMTIMNDYLEELNNWQTELHRQKYEFSITDKDLNGHVPNKRLCQVIKEAQRVPSPEYKKYHTLPPIKRTRTEAPQDDLQLEERQTSTGTPLWEKPEPPDPFFLHLGITARTHSIAEFQTNFPNDVQKFFIDRSMSKESQPSPRHKKLSKIPLEPEQCSEEEENAVSLIVANIIRGLLDDHDFHEALKEIPREPIPYFSQFSEQPVTLSRMEQTPVEPSRELPADADKYDKTIDIQVSSPVPSLNSDKNGSVISPVPSLAKSSSSLGEEMLSAVAFQSSSHSHTEQDYQQSLKEEKKRLQQQTLKRLPEFGNFLESILENSIFNVITEAFQGSVNLTARPRIIALPPSCPSPTQRVGSAGSTDSRRPRSGGRNSNRFEHGAVPSPVIIRTPSAASQVES